MLTLHIVLGVVVIAVCVASAVLGFVAYRRKGTGGAFVSHALVLAQTLLIAQAAVGLLLLSDGRRRPEKLHYTYGALALGLAHTVVLRAGGRAAAASLVRCARRSSPARSRYALSCRGHESHWDRIPSLARGLGILAVVALVVVVLSLESVVATVGGLLQIAFFLAIAFFLFLVWRERRGDLEAWTDWNRKLFYGSILLAVVAIGLAIGYGLPGRVMRSRSSPSSVRARTCSCASGARASVLRESLLRQRKLGPRRTVGDAGFTGCTRRSGVAICPGASRREPRSACTSSPDLR